MSLLLEGPTPHGRPGLRWEDMISSDLLKRDLNMELANNISTWTDAFKTDMNRLRSSPVKMESRESGNTTS